MACSLRRLSKLVVHACESVQLHTTGAVRYACLHWTRTSASSLWCPLMFQTSEGCSPCTLKRKDCQ